LEPYLLYVTKLLDCQLDNWVLDYSRKPTMLKHAGPYKTRHGAQRHSGADVHLNLRKNYLKLGNNYGMGFRVRVMVRYRVRVSV